MNSAKEILILKKGQITDFRERDFRISTDEISAEQMKEFMELLIDLTNMNKSASNQVEDGTRRLLTEIDYKEIDFSELISKLNS